MNLAAAQVFGVVFTMTFFGALGGAALAGDATAPNPKEISPEQARCQAMGEGFFALKGSSQCLRISGYVSAGVTFTQPGLISAPRSGPFAAKATTFTDKQAAVSVESTFDTEAGPARLFLEVGGRSLSR